MYHEQMSFFDKLSRAIAINQSLLVVGLDPNPEMMPQKYTNTGNLNDRIDGLWEWLQFIIEQTSDRVCAYKPTFGFYKALGIAGMELLDRVLTAIPKEIPVILDAKHGDLNSSTIFARTIFQQWQVDAVTLSPFAGIDGVAPFLVYPDKAAFILCHTSNPGAIVLQEYPHPDNPFYLQVVREAKSWGTPEQLALEVGTTDSETIAKIRTIAPERIILIRSIWEEATNFGRILQAGLNKNGEGLLIPVPQDMLASDRPAEKIQLLNREVDRTRNEVMSEASSCNLWTSDVCLLEKHPHQDLILQLFDIGCLLFGEYVQASGATFSYYVDLRTIISNPQVFNQVLNAYAEIIRNLEFDRIAGIPYGSLPTATGLALQLQHPMIYPRKEVKAHGTRRLIEGNYNRGEKVVVVDDILISGKSAIEGVEKLESAGLVVEDVVVLIDHQSGGKDRLGEKGYRSHSVITIAEITETLYEAGRIDREQYQSLT
jgi:uridine monophosphate synthetase